MKSAISDRNGTTFYVEENVLYMARNTMILCHHDDGKEKWQSHQVYLRELSLVEDCYGDCFEEAFSEYKLLLEREILYLSGILNSLEKNEFTIEKVDYAGRAL